MEIFKKIVALPRSSRTAPARCNSRAPTEKSNFSRKNIFKGNFRDNWPGNRSRLVLVPRAERRTASSAFGARIRIPAALAWRFLGGSSRRWSRRWTREGRGSPDKRKFRSLLFLCHNKGKAFFFLKKLDCQLRWAPDCGANNIWILNWNSCIIMLWGKILVSNWET